jgi:outer membrane protein assembly factor BamB
VEASDQTRVDWRVSTPATSNRPPLIADGVAYFGDRDGGVYAVDAVTGASIWTHQHTTTKYNEVTGQPVIVDDLLLVDVDGWLFAHDRSAGSVRWSVKGVGAQFLVIGTVVVAVAEDRVAAWDIRSRERSWRTRKFDGLLAAPPVLAGGLIVVAQAFEPNHVHGGVHAIDPRTGRVVWSVQEDRHDCCLGDNCDDQLFSTPFPVTPAGGLLWMTRLHDHSMGDARFDLVALDAETGRERVVHAATWLATDEQVSGAVAVADGLVYCPAGDRLDAVDGVSGTVRWTHRAEAGIVGSPVRDGAVVHLATGDGWLHALDADTGNPRHSAPVGPATDWAERLDNAAYELVTTPFVHAAGNLYVTTDDGVRAFVHSS